MIKWPVFKENKCYIYKAILFAGVVLPPRSLICILNKPNLYTNISLFLDSFQYAKIFSESLINSYFFSSVVGPDILINVLEDFIVFLILAAYLSFA